MKGQNLNPQPELFPSEEQSRGGSFCTRLHHKPEEPVVANWSDPLQNPQQDPGASWIELCSFLGPCVWVIMS